jgi:formylglycine-generating enzyme required for sulfatase activity
MRLSVLFCLLAGLLAPGLSAHAQSPARNPNGVAILIGNRDYRGVPDVEFAHRDVDAVQRYVIDVLGFDPANVVVVKDATQSQMENALGNERSQQSELWSMVRPGRSDVFVYYSGHGMAGISRPRGFLLPVDVDPARADVSALPLDTLMKNLEALDARSVTVLLDACFTGESGGGGSLVPPNISPLLRGAPPPEAQRGMVILSAAQAGQVAHWDPASRQGLFTEYFLRAVYGAADDRANGGNGDGTVTADEVMKFLDEEMRFAARRQFRREQQATLSGEAAGGRILARFEGGRPPARPSVAAPVAQRPGAPPPAPAASVPQPAVAAPPAAPDTGAVAEAALGLSLEQRRQVQVWLEALGFDPRGIDGQFGPGTRGAIRSFQRSKSLAETGFLSAEVITALAADGPPALARVEEARRARDAAQAALAAARPAAPPAGASPQARPAVGVFPQAPAERPPGMRFRDCADCPEMVVIPAGTFTMGSPASEQGRSDWEGPQQTIRIPRSIAVGRFEVTFAEWDACVAGGGCGGHRPSDQGWGRGNRPAIDVSWQDAQAYVSWLNQRVPGGGYRLLTEAEWEYAARAGSTTAYPWGSSIGSGNANGVDSGTQWSGRQTGPVGSFAANAFGLHDMHGNVWEWTQDCSRGDLNGQPSDGSAFTSGSCGSRVLRGGSWGSSPQFLRSANRIGNSPGGRFNYVGFRVARTPGG